MSVQVRPYLPADREALTALVTRLSEFDLHPWRQAEQIDQTNIAMLETAMDEADPDDAIFVAEVEATGQVVGFVRLQTQTDYFSKGRLGYISNIAVDQSFEGQGIGRMLLEQAEAWGQGKGFDRLTLHVFVENQRARQVYEKFGYQQDIIQYIKVDHERKKKDQAYYDKVMARLTQIARHNMKAFDYLDEEIPDEFVTSDQVAGVPAPPLEKEIPEDANIIKLPSIEETRLGTMSLIDVFKKRRSRRQYTSESLSLEELAYLCWSVAGVHEIGPKGIWTKRTSPSGGARHPFETYLVVQRVDGLEPGIYRYSGLRHQLVFVKTGADFCAQLGETAMQKFVSNSAVIFIWTVIPYRNEWRYMFTSAKQIPMDIGHYCQNLYLAAESIGAGTCAIASYRQEIVDNVLGVDGEDEFTIYISPVGKIEE
jgi:SagB-type dehydrogenase family enzyme